MSLPRLVALLGWPLGHSVSPAMQNAAFRHVGLDWQYIPFAVPPERIVDAVRGLAALGFAGANVTVPHKQSVLTLADEVSEEARTVGATNTLLFTERGIVADNTDVAGFMQAWQDAFGGDTLKGAHAAILGAGGAARAVVVGLARAGVNRITLLNRSVPRAQALLTDLTPLLASIETSVAPLADFPIVLETASAVIQTTSVGMSPHAEEMPITWPLQLRSRIRVMDLVYNPRPTRFLQEAAQRGAAVCDGLPMLVEQGARAFHCWTEQLAPVQVMRKAAEDQLNKTT